MLITMNNLHTLVKQARERRGFRTQGELAVRIGRDTSYVSRLENGALKEIPQPELLRDLADALGYTVVDLLRAAGYDVDAPDTSEVITIRRDDPRARVAEIMDALPDEAVEQWIAALEVLTQAASVNTNRGISSPEGNDENRRRTTA